MKKAVKILLLLLNVVDALCEPIGRANACAPVLMDARLRACAVSLQADRSVPGAAMMAAVRLLALVFWLDVIAVAVWGRVARMNVARKPADVTQLGTKLYKGALLSPDLAIDGIWSVLPTLCATTSSPLTPTQVPFWSVVLRGEYLIDEIHIMFRYSSLQQYRTYTVLVDGKPCYSRTDLSSDPARVEKVRCKAPTGGTNVTISIPSQAASKAKVKPELSVCEVAVFAQTCEPGTFGEKCDQPCGYCERGRTECNPTTGKCPGGCQTGWYGLSCRNANVAMNEMVEYLGTVVAGRGTEVDGGTQQHDLSNCMTLRRQATGAKLLEWRLSLPRKHLINKIALFSPKDREKRQGIRSIEIAIDNQICAVTKNQEAKAKKLFKCRSRTSNYGSQISIKVTDQRKQEMTLCEVEVLVCPEGFWGDACINACPVCKPSAEYCDQVSGKCMDCHKTKGCPSGGVPKLSQPAEQTVEEEDAVANVKSMCKLGFWGPNCTLPCNCLNAQEQCYQADGSCKSGCRPGYEGLNCLKPCEPTFFGTSCDSECRCKNPLEYCNFVTGACRSGCAKGFSGANCSTGDSTVPPSPPLIEGLFNCKTGEFGPQCKLKCNCRKRSEVCQMVTGECRFSGCAAGFTNVDCQAPCPDGTFGLECQKTCRCLDATEVCKKATGDCTKSGCAKGFSGLGCYRPCVAFKHGPNCQLNCRCKDPAEVCEPVTGKCTSGCEAGYNPQDMYCNKTCQSGKYGQDCLQTCGNCLDDACDHVNGTCAKGCDSGWEGSLCKKECNAGMWGPECSRKCRCKDPKEKCHHRTGECKISGCPAGYHGKACDNECSDGSYGDNCLQQCGECEGGGSMCEKKTGACDRCTPGFMGQKCVTKCPKGLYGKNCTSKCGRCFIDDCDEKIGKCTHGCLAGYTGDRCQKLCPEGLYGDGCKKPCGKCKKHCNVTNGVCVPLQSGCQENYVGVKCDHMCGKGKEVCEIPCGHCNGGDKNCNRKKGICTGTPPCQPGYFGVACNSRCPSGTCGQGDTVACSSVCGHCLINSSTCDPESCTCTNGQCQSAYEGKLCNKLVHPTCLKFTECIKCVNCRYGRDDCDYSTGKCKSGCGPGYKGAYCNETCAYLSYGLDCAHKCRCEDELCPCNHINGTCPDKCFLSSGNYTEWTDNGPVFRYLYSNNDKLLTPAETVLTTLPFIVVASAVVAVVVWLKKRKGEQEFAPPPDSDKLPLHNKEN